MTLLASKFGSKPTLSEEFMKKGEVVTLRNALVHQVGISGQVLYRGERVGLGEVQG
jgi:hypothetical protein